MVKIKFHFALILHLMISYEIKAQFYAEEELSPMEIAQELMGPSVKISNVKFNGINQVEHPQWGVGHFHEFLGKVDSLNSGMVLATCPIKYLNQVPKSFTSIDKQDINKGAHHITTDEDFNQLLKHPNSQYFDGSILEFDFISPGESLTFNLIFGSDEYPNFVCSQYNDAFGLFLSGPGINGSYSNNAINLAEISPNKLRLSINSINNGHSGDGISTEKDRNATTHIDNNCEKGLGLNQKDIFIENKGDLVMKELELNGYTKKIKVSSGSLKCFKKYHIKFVIADVSDHRYNSAILIEQGKFNASSKVIPNAKVKIKNSGCLPYTISTTNKTNAKQHYWNFGDGFESNFKEPKHTYEKPGKYIVEYMAIDSGKSNPVATQNIEIEILRAKEFQPTLVLSPIEPCHLSKPTLEIEPKFVGENTDSLIWDFGDNSEEIILTGNEIEHPQKHIYNKPGKYSIKVTAFNFLCNYRTEDSKIIDFKQTTNIDDISVPNVFSPNGDGINDNFFIASSSRPDYNIYQDINEYELDIFDKKGNSLYSSKLSDFSIENGQWSGDTPSGKIPDGVYFYIVKFSLKCQHNNPDRSLSVIKGTVSVIK